jgi:hypothetical protein
VIVIEGATVMIIKTVSTDGPDLIGGSVAGSPKGRSITTCSSVSRRSYVMNRSRTRTLAAVALLAALAVPWGAAGASAVPVTVMATCCSPQVN